MKKSTSNSDMKMVSKFQIVCLLFLVFTAFKSIGQATPIKTIPATSFKIYVPPFDDINLYRIQLRVTTGRGNDAGTDQGVYVQFNEFDNKYYLSKGIDNFEEGHTDTYDVLTENVKQIKDIKFMRFGVKGDDGWCMKRVELYLNNNGDPVFSKEYPGRGSCMDNQGTFTISGSEL